MHRTQETLALALALTATSCGGSSLNNGMPGSEAGGGVCETGPCPAGEAGADLGPAGDTGPRPHVLVSIRVTPQSQVDFIDNGTPVTQAFTATGAYADSTTADVTSMATWTSSAAALGGFPSGVGMNVFTSTTTGGFTTITAAVGSVKGSTILTLVPRRVAACGAPLDFFFIAPYMAGTTPGSSVLAFSTNIQKADLGFVLDSTGSMTAKITNLESSLSSLSSSVKAAVPSVAMGVADFKSWPCAPDGTVAEGDYPWKLDNRIITVSTAAGLTQIQSSITGIAAAGGYDGPEPDFDAAWFAATGLSNTNCAGGTISAFNPATAPGSVSGEATGTIGGMGFRTGALPILVLVSDAESHDQEDPADKAVTKPPTPAFYNNTYAHGHSATLTALGAISAKVIGIASTCGGADFSPTFAGPSVTCTQEPLSQYTWLAEQTKSVVPVSVFGGSCGAGMCCTGVGGAGVAPDTSGNCPLVFQVDSMGTGLGSALTSAIVKLVQNGIMNVGVTLVGQTTDTSGNPLPTGHTTADFLQPISTLKGVVATSSNPAVGSPGGPTSIDTATNQFIGVKPGTTVDFTVKAYNDFVKQLTTGPQFFKATINVIGNGVSFLDSRDVYILVPPAAIIM